MLSGLPQKVLCQLAVEEDDAAAEALMKRMGVPAKEYHLKVLTKVSLLFSSIQFIVPNHNDIHLFASVGVIYTHNDF